MLELLLSADGENTDLLYNLGMAYSDLGRLDRAVTLLRRLLALDPSHVNGRVALGVALTRQRKYAEAETELSQAVARRSGQPVGAPQSRGLPDEPPAARRGDRASARRGRTEARRRARRGTGWAQALEASETTLAGADATYRRVLEIDEIGDLARVAQDAVVEDRRRVVPRNNARRAPHGRRHVLPGRAGAVREDDAGRGAEGRARDCDARQ